MSAGESAPCTARVLRRQAGVQAGLWPGAGGGARASKCHAATGEQGKSRGGGGREKVRRKVKPQKQNGVGICNGARNI